MYEKIRPNSPTYPPKPWAARPDRGNPLGAAVLPPKGSIFPGRPPNLESRERVYAAIVEYAAAHGGNTPTRRELVSICEMSSTSVVNYHITHLIANELLELRDRKLIVCGGTWTPPEGTAPKGYPK